MEEQKERNMKYNMNMPVRIVLFGLLLTAATACQDERVPAKDNNPPVDSTTFSNPILETGPDPWVTQMGDTYYYMHTMGNKIVLRKASRLMYLEHAYSKTVWTPPVGTPYSSNIWAPEMHRIADKWYIYFAADNGQDVNHRMYVLENSAEDPMDGTWEFKGKIADATDKWAIDGTVLEYNGTHYFVWSGWKGDNDPGVQQLYIAKMSNPWTLEGERVLLSEPEHAWEMDGLVNEGPAALKNDKGDVFLTYSGSGCWTDSYAIGLLRLKSGGNPLNPADWTKLPEPLLSTNEANGVYGPGHNGFFKSPDGTQDWIIYHANNFPGQGCGGTRNPRMQPFTWNADGTPDFGEPVAIDTPINSPSGN